MSENGRRHRRGADEDEPQPIYASTRRRRRRRRLSEPALIVGMALLAALIIWTVAKATGTADDKAKREGVVKVIADKHTLRVATARRLSHLSQAKLSRWLQALPRSRQERHGRSTVTLVTSSATLERRVRRAARLGGGAVTLPERPVASSIRLQVFKQALRNNCETAALSMLLRARGARVSQLRLQRELPQSGPLDPRQSTGLPLWGDPNKGFVGRPNGGGTSGGFGVYQAPIVRLAGRHGVRLNRAGSSARQVYHALLRGRPVMAWVGLSGGPFMTWRTAAGKRITGNFGEHTVVLTGVRSGQLTVNDPLSGRQLTWTKSQFELMWQRLGRRALTV